jgi:superoxide dismutase, Fe-Mn family
MDSSKRRFLQQTATLALGAGLATKLHALPSPKASAAAHQIKRAAFELPPLPYAYNALEPIISEETLRLHHGKHHQGYVTTLNTLIAGTHYAGLSLEKIICESYNKDTAIFNNAAQAYNHALYWRSMRPQGGGAPTGKIAQAINAQFGSYARFKEQFLSAATAQFGSGWIWLTHHKDALHIIHTSNANTPLTQSHTPIFVLDVWEHAYYVDYRNARADYAALFLDKLVNWDI